MHKHTCTVHMHCLAVVPKQCGAAGRAAEELVHGWQEMSTLNLAQLEPARQLETVAHRQHPWNMHKDFFLQAERRRSWCTAGRR